MYYDISVLYKRKFQLNYELTLFLDCKLKWGYRVFDCVSRNQLKWEDKSYQNHKIWVFNRFCVSCFHVKVNPFLKDIVLSIYEYGFRNRSFFSTSLHSYFCLPIFFMFLATRTSWFIINSTTYSKDISKISIFPTVCSIAM